MRVCACVRVCLCVLCVCVCVCMCMWCYNYTTFIMHKGILDQSVSGYLNVTAHSLLEELWACKESADNITCGQTIPVAVTPWLLQ